MSRSRWLLLLAALLAGCDKAPESVQRPVLSVLVEPYRQESLGRFAGTVQARHQATLGFRVSGRLVRRLVDVGERVVPGDLLAELEPSDQQTLLRLRQAELADVQARYANARTAVRRQQQLFERGVGSRSQLERLQVQLSALRSRLDQARAAERQASDQLSYSRLYSEQQGVVTAWYTEVGQTVVAGQGALSLARTQEREAVFDLPAELLERMPAETQLRIYAELEPDAVTSGNIRELAPQAEPITRTRRARLSLEQAPRQFHLGTSVMLELSVPVPPRIRLPVAALWQRDGQPYVWVIDPHSLAVAPRAVQLLEQGERTLLVGSGLAAGERVVVAGVNGLVDGQRVKLAEDTP